MKKRKNNRLFYGVLATGFLLNLSGVCILQGELIDRTVAVVNDEVITESEVGELLNPITEQLNQTYKGDELEFYFAKARKEILERLIEDKLILQEARRQKILVDSEEVEQKLSELKEKFSSEEEFEKALRASSTTAGRIRERIREQLMMARLFEKEVRFKVQVNPQEITEYFRNNPDKFKDSPTVKARNITVRFKNAAERLSASRKIKEALSLLKQGRDFKEVAMQYSEGPNATSGGDLDIVKKGQMRDEIDRVIFSLKKGEISDIIETESTFNIFLVEDNMTVEEKSIDEANERIRNILFQKKLKERFNEWIEKLKKDAYISVR